jgi:hypothetical protein
MYFISSIPDSQNNDHNYKYTKIHLQVRRWPGGPEVWTPSIDQDDYEIRANPGTSAG